MNIDGLADAVLDSLIITGGKSRSGGAGIQCELGAQAEIINCLLTKNDAIRKGAPGPGGGLLNLGNTLLDRCVLSNNLANSGGGLSSSGTLELTNCKFLKNTTMLYGAGVSVARGTATLMDCEIAENRSESRGGAGIEFNPIPSTGSSLLLQRCVIRNNLSAQHGAIRIKGKATLENCVVVQNQCQEHAGIHCFENHELTLTHCTILGNSPRGVGFSTDGSAIIESTIIYGNWNDEEDLSLIASAGRKLTLRGANVIGNWNSADDFGTTPLTVDPMLSFTADTQTAFEMPVPLPGSPVIDAASIGDATPATDLRGFNRIMNGNDDAIAMPDIGAFEYDPAQDSSVQPTELKRRSSG